MPDFPVHGRKEMTMLEQVQSRNKEAQSGTGTGMIRYGTEMMDAKMTMLVASASMPMCSYAFWEATFASGAALK
jgi:hypothetical protein